MPIQPELEARVLERLRAGQTAEATEALLRGYGTDLYTFLSLRLPEQDLDDAFAVCCEDIWRGLPAFRAEASVRTWAFRLARHAASRWLRGEGRRKRRITEGGTSAADKIAWEVRTSTRAEERTEVKEKYRALVAELSEEEQEIIVLRHTSGLDWKEIAHACSDDVVEGAELTRAAAVYRKRYERIKSKLKALGQKADA